MSNAGFLGCATGIIFTLIALAITYYWYQLASTMETYLFFLENVGMVPLDEEKKSTVKIKLLDAPKSGKDSSDVGAMSYSNPYRFESLGTQATLVDSQYDAGIYRSAAWDYPISEKLLAVGVQAMHSNELDMLVIIPEQDMSSCLVQAFWQCWYYLYHPPPTSFEDNGQSAPLRLAQVLTHISHFASLTFVSPRLLRVSGMRVPLANTAGYEAAVMSATLPPHPSANLTLVDYVDMLQCLGRFQQDRHMRGYTHADADAHAHARKHAQKHEQKHGTPVWTLLLSIQWQAGVLLASTLGVVLLWLLCPWVSTLSLWLLPPPTLCFYRFTSLLLPASDVLSYPQSLRWQYHLLLRLIFPRIDAREADSNGEGSSGNSNSNTTKPSSSRIGKEAKQ